MKIGDLVKIKEIPQENEERDIGIIVDIGPDQTKEGLDVWVKWSASGVHWHSPSHMEVINESR